MIKTATWIALVVALTTALFAKAPAKAQLTVMLYQCSDNNLEGAQINDLREMLAAGGTKQVNFIVFCDRHESGEEPHFTNASVGGLKNWTTAKILKIHKNRLEELADWGEVDTTDGNVLARFIDFATKWCPADRYGLILEDHGGGWTGGFADDTSKDDIGELTVPEIRSALAAHQKKTGKLEFIGFDACLMANLEVAHAVSPFAKVMIASQETEPGSGWYYTPLFNALNKNPKMTGAAFGKLAVEEYFKSYVTSKDEYIRKQVPMLTLSAVDLSKIPAVVKAVQSVGTLSAKELEKSREQWIQFASARSITEEYAVDDMSDPLDVYDAISLFRNISKRKLDAQTVQAAKQSVQLMSAAVISAKGGAARPEANGLTIFVPKLPDALEETKGNFYGALPFNQSKDWTTFLMALSKETVEDDVPPVIGTINLADTTITGANTVDINANMQEKDVAEAWLVLGRKHDVRDDSVILLGRMPAIYGDSNKVAVAWDGKWFLLTDGDNFYICPITNYTKNSGGMIFWINAQVQRKGKSAWQNASLVFFLDAKSRGNAKFVYAIQKTEYGFIEIPVREGDKVRPLFVEGLANAEPRIVFMEGGPLLTVNKDFVISYGNVPNGEYLIGFVAVDYAENSNASFTQCTVKREGESAPPVPATKSAGIRPKPPTKRTPPLLMAIGVL